MADETMSPPYQPDDPGGVFAEMAALRRFVALRTEERQPVIEVPAAAKLTNVLLTILSLLVVAEMVGGVNLYAKVEAMQSTMQLIVDGKIVIVRMP